MICRDDVSRECSAEDREQREGNPATLTNTDIWSAEWSAYLPRLPDREKTGMEMFGTWTPGQGHFQGCGKDSRLSR